MDLGPKDHASSADNSARHNRPTCDRSRLRSPHRVHRSPPPLLLSSPPAKARLGFPASTQRVFIADYWCPLGSRDRAPPLGIPEPTRSIGSPRSQYLRQAIPRPEPRYSCGSRGIFSVFPVGHAIGIEQKIRRHLEVEVVAGLGELLHRLNSLDLRAERRTDEPCGSGHDATGVLILLESRCTQDFDDAPLLIVEFDAGFIAQRCFIGVTGIAGAGELVGTAQLVHLEHQDVLAGLQVALMPEHCCCASEACEDEGFGSTLALALGIAQTRVGR